jgi:hypothetical protein
MPTTAKDLPYLYYMNSLYPKIPPADQKSAISSPVVMTINGGLFSTNHIFSVYKTKPKILLEFVAFFFVS